jgi:transposase-like protein
MNHDQNWVCPECGREYDDLSEGPCPADDCPSHEAEPVAETMSLHEALRVALSTIYATLDEAENADTEDWMTPPDALREAARVIDIHMRTTK